MKALFGMCSASMGQVRKAIPSACKAQVCTYESNTVNKHVDVWLVPSLRMLKKKMPFRGVVIVFDSPLYLSSITSLEFLDVTRNTAHTFNFKHFTPSLLDPVRKALRLKDRKKFDLSEVDYFHSIIENVTSGTVLDKYNQLFYSLPGTKEKIVLKAALLKFMFEDAPLSIVKKVLEDSFSDEELCCEYLDDLVAFLDSPEGRNVKDACKDVRDSRIELLKKKKPLSVPYARIIKKYGVDRFELKYLAKTYYKNCGDDDPAMMEG